MLYCDAATFCRRRNDAGIMTDETGRRCAQESIDIIIMKNNYYYLFIKNNFDYLLTVRKKDRKTAVLSFCGERFLCSIFAFVVMCNYTIIFNTLSEVFEISKILFANTPSILIFATH